MSIEKPAFPIEKKDVVIQKLIQALLSSIELLVRYDGEYGEFQNEIYRLRDIATRAERGQRISY